MCFSGVLPSLVIVPALVQAKYNSRIKDRLDSECKVESSSYSFDKLVDYGRPVGWRSM